MDNNQKDSNPSRSPRAGQLVRPGPISHAFGLDNSLQDLYPSVPSSMTGRLVRVPPKSTNKSTGLSNAQQDFSPLSSPIPSQFIQSGPASSTRSLTPERYQKGKGLKHWYKRQKREMQIGICFGCFMLLLIVGLGVVTAIATSQPDASTSTHPITPVQIIPTFATTPTPTHKIIYSAPVGTSAAGPIATPTVENAVTPTPININP